jgi:hypothetical protein
MVPAAFRQLLAPQYQQLFAKFVATQNGAAMLAALIAMLNTAIVRCIVKRILFETLTEVTFKSFAPAALVGRAWKSRANLRSLACNRPEWRPI